ncbi:phosphoribosylformylglycinamidine synthase [Eremomyces bilateralis CBS 781.70]|uniref:Phosphoribosylformylglycinamidine synthase n=1 Tax=Eremomyces bilateralis CBS 781.70 TaxID=1392243 RepID=A0A6G1G2X7_9PEZI|nr:phosphoribosylformylglycinamidine synthase [Eremomyces bilateralis CBS 781.70]KAF1812342.1 phosphoribosylformylglycinamidine synthase [Eremomyces bilateralis CBS 781.70]
MASQNFPYHTVPGSVALSEFRAARLATSLGAEEVKALWVHFIEPFQKSGDEETNVLGSLLEYGDAFGEQDSLSRAASNAITRGEKPNTSTISLFFVAPRPGTISPWSSKATNIAHVCTLDRSIKRIERGMVIAARFKEPLDEISIPHADELHDRMTQTISRTMPDLSMMFGEHEPGQLETVPILNQGESSREALQRANRELGLALDSSEVDYLIDAYQNQLKRDPTDVELFMFAQVNSEHCRHKQFNADWTIDGLRKERSLFGMIKNTYLKNPGYVVSAYSDNAAVFEGQSAVHWAPEYSTGNWKDTKEVVHYLGKVETHNHPTAVSPFPGAATGAGGEIRDEGAVGRGSKPKAGLSGFTVSDLLISDFRQPWELDVGKPAHIASSLDIMIEAPIGSASYNNEFGRPCTAGYFRTFLAEVDNELRGFHKPIMIAGGVGTVRPNDALKEKGLVKSGDKVIVLGGPAMLIGLGGGAASSVQSGEGKVELDFASVQRGNAEVQRRAQEVINTCTALGKRNPIQSIHDVGAGGLSNALPELVHDAGFGAVFELREVDSADKSMSPLQIWCCEAQERYVMAISEEGLSQFQAICKRERCGFSVVGVAKGWEAQQDSRLILVDRDSPENPYPIDLPMSTLFGKPPKMTRIVKSRKLNLPAIDRSLQSYLPGLNDTEILHEAVNRVLALPCVGSKSFLITIGDRTVGGLTVREQMVGKWQTPVADVSVTAASLLSGVKCGEAMAMGERPTLALISPAASARMAVAESLMNLAAADILDGLKRVALSANWMAASGHEGDGAALYEAVHAIGMDLCPKLGVKIPVGKDSMSMKMKWSDQEKGDVTEITAPVTVVITAFTAVRSLMDTWTPALRRLEDVGETVLLFVDLAAGKKALGGSALAQVFKQVGNEAPDVRDAFTLKDYFAAIEELHESGIVLAYHDRSDGGLFTTLAEMMFAGRCGLDINLEEISSADHGSLIETLFNEELGAVFQVRKSDEVRFNSCFATCGPPKGLITRIGKTTEVSKQNLSFFRGASMLYKESRITLQQRWASTSYHIQKLRDNPACAEEEFASLAGSNDPGLSYRLTFNPKDNILPFKSIIPAALVARPKVAILREQGVNGQSEMAFGFHVAGFQAVDVHMTDIISGRVSLAAFTGLAACGGFSYGDVLGAGRGWAMSVLFNAKVRQEFKDFFERQDTFTLGVCNGCQFLSRLKHLIPGASSWPSFERNTSEQYEARVCMVEVLDTPAAPSVFFHGMKGSKLPIVVAHGEGRAQFTRDSSPHSLSQEGLVPLRYVDNYLHPTEKYPYNPNGSPMGIAGVRSPDGRVLAVMPHVERTILKPVASWIPDAQSEDWGDFGPWVRVFQSARRWVG